MPKTSSFDEVYEVLKKEVNENDNILAATIYGSFFYKKHNRQSDLDCILIHDGLEGDVEARDILPRTFAKKDALSVPFGPSILKKDDAQSGNHRISASFLQQFKRINQKGGAIKGDVVAIIKPVDNLDNLLKYLPRVRSTVENDVESLDDMDEEKYHLFLGRILSLPVSVAKKVIEVMAGEVPDGADKSEVVSMYANLPFDRMATEILRDFERANKEYKMVLEAQLANPDEALYRRELLRIEGLAPKLMQFAEINLREIKKHKKVIE